MAHVAPVYPSFARGEVSPLMLGRIDLEQYNTCLEKCRNAYIRPYGCITRLTGTEFISQTKNSGKVRLLKFVFSPTDSYIIECGAGYFRFYQNGAPVMNGANIYEVANNYYEDQLDSIQYVQIDDIIKLVCLPHNNDNTTAKPKELIRNASNNWTFRNVTFIETPYLDQNTSDIEMTASAVTGNSITITASSAYFTSSMVGANMWLGTKVKDTETNKDVQGYVKITAYTDSTHVTAKVMSKLSGTSATKLWGEGAFSDRRGYPAVIALFDGRLYYARTPYQPRNVYGSKPYAYEVFTPAVDNEDDAGINVQLATNANGDGSDIKWMVGASYLLCGTYGGEFVIRAAGDGAITPTDISARQRTNWGGEPVQPIVAGTFVHFLQRNGNKLRQFQYDFYYDSYKAVDVSIFSEHLLASPIKEMALQKNPDSIIYLMREDGNVVMLTLEQDQSVQAWSLLEDLGAKVESIQTIPSYNGNYDEVYMVMKRDLLSTTASYTCSNPALDVSLNYSGTKLIEGDEIVTLYYNSLIEGWTNPNSNITYTNLKVTSSNENLTFINNYSLVKPNINEEEETLKFIASDSLMIWTAQNTAGAGGSMHSTDEMTAICYGADKYVAITKEGADTTSTNGLLNWSPLGYPVNLGNHNWSGLTYSNGTYIAIGKYGYISTSTNGTTWTSATKKLDGNLWQAICMDENYAVAIQYNGYVSVSANAGQTWLTPFTNSKFNGHRWVSITYVGGSTEKYVALSEDGYITTSKKGNGLEWTTTKSMSFLPYRWKSLIAIGTRLYAFETFGHIFSFRVSSDGTPVDVKEVRGLSYLLNPSVWVSATTDGEKIVMLNKDRKVTNGELGAWQSLTTEEIVDITDENYALRLTSLPDINDTLSFHWYTTHNYAPLEDYNLTVEGNPLPYDNITITYHTTSSPARYIERMQNPITQKEPINWWYVRSGLKYDGYAITAGNKLTLSSNSIGSATATAASSIFTSSMVGNRIRLIDDDYNVLGEAEITAYTSGTVVTLDITSSFPVLELAGGKWGISTDVLSGLSHLTSKTVQVFADGKQQEDKVVTDGSINIDDAFIAVVGLPYTSYITTMPMEAGSQNGTAVGKRKRISEMAIRVWNTIGVRVGRDLDNLYDTIYEQKEPFTGVIPNIKYNQGWVWDANITIEQSHPYPMNILSIAPIVTEVDK